MEGINVIGSDSDPDPPRGDEPGCHPEDRPAYVRRTAWKNMNVPPHIVMSSDQVTERLSCNKRGARATAQYRVQFIKTHAACTG
eukprot:3043736-Amphidinium_carterae.4